jgi:hypothetical protein
LRITESYKNWEPPSYVRRLTQELIAAVPEKYLSGLEAIVLTNQASLNHDRRRGKTWSRGKKVSLSRCLGLYHRKRRGQGAWVEIFVDQIIDGWSRFVRAVPFLRELFFAETLYHELGHHIHATQAPEHKEREDVADEWRDR